MSGAGFTPETLRFLADLTAHNDRDWFAANKDRYEAHVKAPALAFIAALAPRFAAEVSPHVRVDARALFRIHRDTRFSPDKTPYKTHLGLHFRHDVARDVHAPGFYLHLAVDDCFFGVGLWRPDGPSLKRIRTHIDQHPDVWDAADAAVARAGLAWHGDALQRVPKPWSADHPRAAMLRRKDHVATVEVPYDLVLSPGLLDRYVDICVKAAPVARAICGALGLAF